MNTKHQLISQSTIIFSSLTKQARLKQPVASTVETSYSTVLTMAGFLLAHYPQMLPPRAEGLPGNGSFIRNENQQGCLTFNRLYEPWCDYLADLFLSNKVIQDGIVCSFNDMVDQQFINHLTEDLFFIQAKPQYLNSHSQTLSTSQTPKSHKEITRQSLAPQQPSPKPKKIGIINFATSQLRTDPIRPRIHLVGLFAGIFFNQGDQWKLFNVLKQEYPSNQDYTELDTVILSGSSLSVNDETPEVVAFLKTLEQGIKLNPKLKILGVCFGHQALAKMFGGKIVEKQLLTGVQTINFNPSLTPTIPYFPHPQTTFQLSEYHKDFVVQVPENFNILAQSQTCTIESLISKDMKYLSFQFHPEYSAEYIRSFEIRLEHYQIFDLKSSYSRSEIGSIRHDKSLWEIRRVIRNFLDWEVSRE